MIRKHSITLRGHRTSFSLENPFMDELRAIADERNLPLAALITELDENRDPTANLSSALRLYVLNWLKAKAQKT
ncbi:ribbon-helix-helix domain-containing protein [Rhizobium sp. S95]|uniref:Ribbon-helix-helix domain-containing protein n=1 Tax=Ciceribacter sichuanensis TaxID=2949647 RepID=A0AAJ1BUL7_9HYPH|nr:ribbon-helix-helix domain-containing protein [Ciceribacter sp. S95]MCO5956667.1 ribbon-helix-helix domain-containing protein [Ciceribacter sp. S101]